MRITNNIRKVIDFCEDNNCEIISYGLAPNPFGFCFETESNDAKIKITLHNLLENLSESEVKKLRKFIFQ